jgi:hypothetical protein
LQQLNTTRTHYLKFSHEVPSTPSMAHLICCPYQRSTERSNDTPEPCRPPITLDGTFTQGFLPQDHPHAMTGRRLLLSPVDFIMKSPRIADKIKLKMSKKSTRTLRQELDRLSESHYSQDAHALTSTDVLDMTGSIAFRGASDNGRHGLGDSGRATQRSGILDGPGRPVISRSSIYSRSPSGTKREPMRRLMVSSQSMYSRSPSATEVEPLRSTGTAATDPHGLSYRSVLPRQPSISELQSAQLHDRVHSQQKSVHSRHWSGSTESTIQRRLDQSALDFLAEPVAQWTPAAPAGDRVPQCRHHER